MPMKILFLALDVNIKSKTGDAVHVRELAYSLAKIGNEVSLIAPHTDDGSEELTPLRNQSNIHIYFNKPKRHFRTLYTIRYCRKIAQNQASEIVYERRFSPKIGYSLNKLLKMPFVVEINGLKDKEMELQNIKTKSGLIPKKLRRKIWRHLFSSAKKVVVVSHGLKKALSEEYGLDSEKITVINNGANTDLFKPLDGVKCREELGLNPNYRYVGFVGNLVPWQGVEQFIKLAPMVIDTIPNIRFIVVGGGILKSQLEKSAEEMGLRDKIIFTGFVPYESVPKYINSFEICVAPFSGIERNVRYSFSAIKLYEYMACGKPVVTTDVVGIKKEITELALGKLVKADDLEGLTSAIVELLKNPGLQKDVGTRAMAWVAKEHSWEKVAKRVSGVCKNVLATT